MILAASTRAISGPSDAGGPDPQDQLVVVGPLADAGVLDVVFDADGPG